MLSGCEKTNVSMFHNGANILNANENLRFKIYRHVNAKRATPKNIKTLFVNSLLPSLVIKLRAVWTTPSKLVISSFVSFKVLLDSAAQ